MGFTNPQWTWNELEARLSGRDLSPGRDGRAPGSPAWNAGGDAPAWSRRRQPFEPPVANRSAPATRVPYAELHTRSNFSFLEGASHPEALVTEAARLGLEALAITDRDGFHGVVRFAEAARTLGVPTVFGAEVTGLAPIGTTPGDRVVLLADGPGGYARLARGLSIGLLAGSKGAPGHDLDRLGTEVSGVTWVLTGDAAGLVPAALCAEGPTAARRELERLVDRFGRDRVLVELWDHGDPIDHHRNDALVELAHRVGVGCVAANAITHATPAEADLAMAVQALGVRRSLEAARSQMASNGGAHLRSGAEQRRRFERYPGVLERTVDVARSAAFDLSLVAPALPPYPCPDGLDEMGYLRSLTADGARRRYGERPGIGEDMTLRSRAWTTIDRELALIEQLGFAGYFLVVWDIVEFCRRHDIYCQGRGSAANSAVCYALGITAADAVSLGLLFERFLSPHRDGPPDIDLDIESGRREEVIQYVYARYGRHHTAQVANVITYRARSAIRDAARALGHDPGRQDAWSRHVERWSGVERNAERSQGAIPDQVVELAARLEDAPRHLGVHSGGMVICDRPVIEVCPVEWARADGRSVLQWDKDDCAAAGLVKFDLLGLGMLSALHNAVDLVAEHRGYQIDLATLPQEDEVYAMLCRADTVGVFQVESRAQMATLPRLRPRRFYDLVVEVALIRPGPIQGGSVHPYIRRRNGLEPVTYLHPLLENSLSKTLGVPLFQEQLMQMAIDVAGFSAAEADELRQAMGSKRSAARMERLRSRFYDGMASRGITGGIADEIYMKMKAFANYGFPESHSVSFAYLVYASAWIKHHEPAAFCAALLNAQPMGFWSPHTLVRDARRHGVEVRTVDLNSSQAGATLIDNGSAIRLGLAPVRQVGRDLADRIVAERDASGPYASPEDLVRRVPEVTVAHLEALATAGAFEESCGLGRREALWMAGAAARSRPGTIPGMADEISTPRLPGMTPVEEAVADLWSTGVSPDGHPTSFLRSELDRLGVVTASRLGEHEADRTVVVAGVVTHRQRPMTARGTTFMNLEDETGLINVVVSTGCWTRFRHVARSAPALVVRGRLERSEGVVNIVAEHLQPLAAPGRSRSRNFR
ncbi:MAG: error-prone DNA polymerase [Actinomycetota bacterium]|jgi:error-prone DNA polymerase|nr:error-prone DNA polymerase [Actinomycetota bacterium]MDA3014034.1 error-prone DNA polymerase [Actinomycetota bacterium]MDA3027372.1 error-prone DNA polymerase [Actinomycetota bacterium]